MPDFAEAYKDPETRRRHRDRVLDAMQASYLHYLKIISALFGLALVGLVLLVLILEALGGWSGWILFLYARVFVWGFVAFLTACVFIAGPLALLAGRIEHRQLLEFGYMVGPGFCRGCGYALAGLSSDRSPECGAPLQ